MPKVSGSGLLECSRAARLDCVPASCVLPPASCVLPALCCAAFELANKRKALALPAGRLTTYGLQLVMHLTCTHTRTHSHTLPYTHSIKALCCFNFLPGRTRRMRNMPPANAEVPTVCSFMRGANNSRRNQSSLNASNFYLSSLPSHA